MVKRPADNSSDAQSPGKFAKSKKQPAAPAVQQQQQQISKPAGAAASGAAAVVQVLEQQSASGAAAVVQQQPVATLQKYHALMIANTKPFRPCKPSADDIVAGRACSVRTYMQNLQAYVWSNFSVFLHDDDVIKLRTPLYAAGCPQIDNTPKTAPAKSINWRPTSIKEPLDMEHCISALKHSEFYEGTISIWNIDIMKTRAFNKELNLRDPTWDQLNVLNGYWSEATLVSSAADEAKRRYFWPGIVLSFVNEIGL